MYDIERDDDEINELLDTCSAHANESKFPGMTYEEGIRAAIEWVTGESDEKPMAD